MARSVQRLGVGYHPGLFTAAGSAGALLGLAQVGFGLPLFLYAGYTSLASGTPDAVLLGVGVALLCTGILTAGFRNRMRLPLRHIVLCWMGAAGLLCQVATGGQPVSFTFAWTPSLLALIAFAVIPAAQSLLYPIVFIPLALVTLAVSPGTAPADVAMATLLMLATGLGLTWFARSALLAETDDLTGIPNFAGFEQVLSAAMRDAGPDESLALVRLDINEFALVNRRAGQEAGDAAMVAFVAGVSDALPAAAVMARVEGDAFAILLPGFTAARARDLLEGLHGQVAGFSAGIAVREGNESESEFFGRAGKALFEAQRVGRGKIVTHGGYYASPTAVRDGLANGEFFLSFQPVIELAGGHAVGAEALVRWQHPTRGLVPPAEFIPLCEASGSIQVLGQWIVRESIAVAEHWRRVRSPEGNPLSVSINASARELASSGYAAYVLAECAAVGFPPGLVRIEVTETEFGSDTAAVRDNIRLLRGAGVLISMDDFGTGHSSLSRLTEIDLDVIKIDRSFVGVIDTDTQSPVAELAIKLAAALGLDVIAEGVETETQARWLRDRGCTFAQGYLYSPPLSAGSFVAEFVDERSTS
ncbi:bifunctional diguanylate cyclase/phosphodiesterase [Cryobacterium sp. PAMC25264]|uniref:bifunctional diguanylate cyclase/phosphodiesterase n=1 Tax=Cryobacterium sp. PAMC25264 TaxID=2861288 RepID=UPI001C62A415|nr:bifunctional diguanylate cyclase/phosphodiesterase [Cryobacterium sp. PAMC25264]QYF73507.1 bifunctional diguanylate cyclase/phosphodiesterase [Cryobacterium sp. PAMC25264]